MAITVEELKTFIIKKLVPKYRAELVWSVMVGAVQAAPASDKNMLVEYLRNGSPREAGAVLYKMVMDDARASAATEAQTYVDDESLSFEEIQRILG